MRYRPNASGPWDTAIVRHQALHALLPGVDRSITNIRISSLTPTFFWDRRDDPLDPHRGFFTSASVQYAFKALNADAHFLKEFTQGSWYLPLTQRTVFATSARIGLIQPLGQIVPLSERFTAGGESSHRAYALDLLGTLCLDPDNRNCHATLLLLEDGKVAPIGGSGLFVANAEYRFPIFSSVGGAIFADAGNVFADTAISVGDLRYGVGTGVRYLSPVGPVRFDLGWKLKRQLNGCENPIVLPDLSRVCGPGTGKQKFEKPFAWFVTLGYAF